MRLARLNLKAVVLRPCVEPTEYRQNLKNGLERLLKAGFLRGTRSDAERAATSPNWRDGPFSAAEWEPLCPSCASRHCELPSCSQGSPLFWLSEKPGNRLLAPRFREHRRNLLAVAGVSAPVRASPPWAGLFLPLSPGPGWLLVEGLIPRTKELVAGPVVAATLLLPTSKAQTGSGVLETLLG